MGWAHRHGHRHRHTHSSAGPLVSAAPTVPYTQPHRLQSALPVLAGGATVHRSGRLPTTAAATAAAAAVAATTASSMCRWQPRRLLHGTHCAYFGGHWFGSDLGRRFSTSGHATAREIAEQLQRAEERKAAAFGRNDFAALPELHAEVERLTGVLQQTELAGKVESREREELERSQEERLAQLRAGAEHAKSSAQAAVRDKL